MRFLIVDDHAVVRRGVKETLAEAFEGLEFGEAHDARKALKLIRQQAWDLVLLDIGLPGRSGLDLLQDIKAALPGLPVLVLSVHSEEQFAVRVLRAGGAGFMSKDQAAEELVEAVRCVLAGERYIGPGLAQTLVRQFVEREDRPRHELLSSREFEVLRLIASGMTVSEIAAELSLSVKTISTYRSRMLEKLGLENNAQAMAYALRHGLLP